MSDVRDPEGGEDPAHAEAVREFEDAIRSRIKVTGRSHQSWTDILEVLVDLGYKKAPEGRDEAEARGGIMRAASKDTAADSLPRGPSREPSEPR